MTKSEMANYIEELEAKLEESNYWSRWLSQQLADVDAELKFIRLLAKSR